MSSANISLFLVYAPCTLLPLTSECSILGKSHMSQPLSHSSLSSKFSYIFCRVVSGNDTIPVGAILISLYSFCLQCNTGQYNNQFAPNTQKTLGTSQDTYGRGSGGSR